MERNDNSAYHSDNDAAASTTASIQENQPTPKPKRKKRKLLCVGVLFLLGAALPLPLFITPYATLDDSLAQYYHVSRDGVLFDHSTLDPLTARSVVTNSWDDFWYSTNSHDPVLDSSITPSGSFVTRIKFDINERQAIKEYQYEKLSNQELSNYFLLGTPSAFEEAPSMTRCSTYSVETRDLVSEEVTASEKLLDVDASYDAAMPVCVLSEDKLLFRRRNASGHGTEYYWEYFWFVKSDDQWTKIPLDFGIERDCYAATIEVVREKSSILFLLSSRTRETEYEYYAASYNYETFSVEKTIKLPFVCSREASVGKALTPVIRVLSGAQHFCAYQAVREEKTDAYTLNSIVFSTQDLTKVKETTISGVKMDGTTYFHLVMSPDLRYVACGAYHFYLYDLELQQEIYLRSFLPASLKRFFSDSYHILRDFGHRRSSPRLATDYAAIYSAGFSKDSRFLIASDGLGNVYRWDLQNKKRAKKIINSKY
jgi:hypothetical protein